MTIVLTDQNFEQEISKAEKPVLVDFWAEWCQPCLMLSPILEKVAEEYKEKIIFAKVNLDEAPATAQKYQVDRIPMVMLFKKGKPIGAFMGLKPETTVKEIIDEMLKDAGNKEEEKERDEEEGKENIEKIIQFYQEYAEKNGFKINPNQEVVERLVKGLLENEKKYKARYCPCRRVSGNIEEDKGKICPCQWHRQELEKDGTCFCGLFVK